MAASMMAAPTRSSRHRSGRSRRRRHRSLSAEGRADPDQLQRPSASGSEMSYRKALAHSILSNGEGRHRRYVEMASTGGGLQSPSTSTTGPMSARDFRRHQDECSTCSSSSESDDDDAFLANYLAASLPRVNQIGQRVAQMQEKSHYGRTRRRLVVRADGKKTGSSNCIVS